MIQLTEDQLWEAIYASRNAEKYLKLRRREVSNTGSDPYDYDELTQMLNNQREVTKSLEALAPAHTW